MTSRDLPDTLSSTYETELSRLGSSKAIYALSEGDMDADAVFTALGTRSTHATDTLDHWADTEDHPDATDLFTTLATTERDRATELLADTDTDPDPTPPPAIDHLADLNDTLSRTAGLAAWLLIQDQTYSQTVGFFVGSANRDAADRFRAYRDDITDALTQTTNLLDTLCESDDDWDRAIETGGDIVTTAYDTYATTLEAMGINVKPIC